MLSCVPTMCGGVVPCVGAGASTTFVVVVLETCCLDLFETTLSNCVDTCVGTFVDTFVDKFAQP